MSTFEVHLNSPTISFDLVEITKVDVQSESGAIEILPNHTKILTQISISYLDLYLAKGGIESYFVNGGVLIFDNSLKIVSSEIQLASKLDKTWLETLKQKRQLVRTQTQKAKSFGQFFEAKEDVNLTYLLAEERLAKIQLFQELFK